MIRIITQTQYDAIIDIVREAAQDIEQLQKENEQLRKENKRLSIDLRDLQNFCINFAADQKAKAIDFPNSTNYQLADFETDFPGINPEDIF